MKAVIFKKYGSPDALRLVDIEKPIPADNEVLVKIYAATVTAGDIAIRRMPGIMWLLMRLFGFKKKKVAGHEFSGVIEKVGEKVKLFKVGDHVFGTTTGLRVGSNAEYASLPEYWKAGVISLKPVNVTHEVAAAVPVGGMTAIYFLKKATIEDGQNVLIYGASGSVGTYAVQLAKYFGAEVTGVCSTSNIELVKSLGADRVIDYTKGDVQLEKDYYDIIFDAVGKFSKSSAQNALKPNGRFVAVNRGLAKERKEDLVVLQELVDAGEIKPVIDKKYPLERIMEAYQYVESKHKRGNVVIEIEDK